MTIEALQTLIEQCGVHPAVGLEAGGWGIEQNAWELARFLYAMQELGVSSVLEIGTGAQAGLSRFMHEHMHWHVTTVDKNGHYGDYPGIEFVVSEERRDFGDRTFDLVIIDGDHAYESVKADHEWYGKYATKAMMFHDIAGLRDCEGAKRYWLQLVGTNAEYTKESINVKVEGLYNIIIAVGEQRCGIGWYDVESARLLRMYKAITSTDAYSGLRQIEKVMAESAPIEVTITDSEPITELVIPDTPELREALEEAKAEYESQTRRNPEIKVVSRSYPEDKPAPKRKRKSK